MNEFIWNERKTEKTVKRKKWLSDAKIKLLYKYIAFERDRKQNNKQLSDWRRSSWSNIYRKSSSSKDSSIFHWVSKYFDYVSHFHRWWCCCCWLYSIARPFALFRPPHRKIHGCGAKGRQQRRMHLILYLFWVCNRKFAVWIMDWRSFSFAFLSMSSFKGINGARARIQSGDTIQ